MIPAAKHLNSVGDGESDGSEVAHMLSAPKGCGRFTDGWPEWISVLAEQTDDVLACTVEMIIHPPVVMQIDITNERVHWVHMVADKYHEDVEDLI